MDPIIKEARRRLIAMGIKKVSVMLRKRQKYFFAKPIKGVFDKVIIVYYPRTKKEKSIYKKVFDSLPEDPSFFGYEGEDIGGYYYEDIKKRFSR